MFYWVLDKPLIILDLGVSTAIMLSRRNWTLDLSTEAVNCKIEHANDKFAA